MIVNEESGIFYIEILKTKWFSKKEIVRLIDFKKSAVPYKG